MKKVLQGGGLVTLGTLATNFIQFFVGIMVVRILTVGEYGDFSLANTTVALLSVLGLLGMPAAMVKLAVQAEAGRVPGVSAGTILGSSSFLVFLSCSALAVLVFVYAEDLGAALNSEQLAEVLFFLAWTIPLTAALRLLSSFYQYQSNALPRVLFQDLLPTILRLVVVLAAFWIGVTFQTFLSLYLIVAILAAGIFIAFVWVNQGKSLQLGLSLEGIRLLLSTGLPIVGVALLGNLSLWMITAITSYFHPAEIVAYFSAPSRLIIFLTLPMTALGYLYLPQASKLTGSEHRESLQALYRSLSQWSVLLAVPMFVYLAFEAEFVVLFLFGEAYSESAWVLRLILLGSAASVIYGLTYLTLVALGASKVMIASSGVSVIMIALAGFAVIPHWGHLGAATAFATGTVALHAVLAYNLYTRFKLSTFSRRQMLTVVLAILLNIGVLLLLREYLVGLPMAFAFAALAYLMVLMTPFLLGKPDRFDQQVYKMLRLPLPNRFFR